MSAAQTAAGTQLRTCVFGAGGVGGHMAVKLMSAGLPVSIIARGDHLRAVQENGLTLLLDGDNSMTCRPVATSDPAELGVQDLLVISVKLGAVHDVLRAAQPLIGEQTRVIFAMNGMPWWFPVGLPLQANGRLENLLDPSRELHRLVSVDRWVACVVTSANRVVAPGVIQSESPKTNRLVLGFEDGRSDDMVDSFAHYASFAGYDVTLTGQIRHAIWQKLLINAAVSAVSTLIECSTKKACEDRGVRELIISLMHEILAIGRALGIDLQSDPEAATDPATMPDHITSFLQDLWAKRPLEISNGILAVSELANLMAIDAPRLKSVASLLAARSALSR